MSDLYQCAFASFECPYALTATAACAQEWMQTVMQDVQQLLPLLTVAVASPSNVAAAVDDLHLRTIALEGSSAEAAAHLGQIRATIEALAATNATAPEVEACMTTLRNSMLQLHEESLEEVLKGCEVLQTTLGEGLDRVMEAVDVMRLTVESFSRQMLELQQRMKTDLEQIKQYLAGFCGISGSAAHSLQHGRIIAVRPLT